MDLVLRGELNYQLRDVERLVEMFRNDPRERDGGYLYYTRKPNTSPDHLLPEDIAWALLIDAFYNVFDAKRVFRSIIDNGPGLDLSVLARKPLEETSTAERSSIVEVVAEVAQWPGMKASVATKLLHKKRPDLIPVLDNKAIFGAYRNSEWPKKPATGDSVSDPGRIGAALDWIHHDLTRPENLSTWNALAACQPEPGRSRIELFDMLWWVHCNYVEKPQTSTLRLD